MQSFSRIVGGICLFRTIFYGPTKRHSYRTVFNSRYILHWAEENLHVVRKGAFQYRWSINVWAGIIGNQVISVNKKRDLFLLKVKYFCSEFPDRSVFFTISFNWRNILKFSRERVARPSRECTASRAGAADFSARRSSGLFSERSTRFIKRTLSR